MAPSLSTRFECRRLVRGRACRSVGAVGALPGCLHGSGCICRLHLPRGELDRHVIDDRTDRRAKHLVVVDLVVVGLRDVLRQLAKDRIGDGVLRSIHNGDVGAALSRDALVARLREEAQEFGGHPYAVHSQARNQYGGQAIYVYGDSPVGNADNELPGSGTYSVPLNPTAPQPPASITVPATSNTGDISVSWAPSAGATSYVLQQQLNGGAWTQVYSGSGTSTAINGLSGGTYVYRVEACNDNGCSGFTTSGNLVVALKPPTPSSISVPATSSTGIITVAWGQSAGATSYILQQQLNGGSWSQVYNGTATSQAFSGLGDGSYVFRAQACNANGCSDWKTSGTLTVALIPVTPTSINVPGSSSTGSFAV